MIGDSTVRETTQERLSFYVDAESPDLALDNDGPVYTNKDKYTISGTVTDDYNYYELSINNNHIESAWGDVDFHSEEGFKKNFKYEAELKQGKNTFNIKITDSQGNETTQALIVYYEPEKVLDEPDIKQTVAKDGESALLEATTKEPDATVVYSVDDGKTFKDVPADGLKVTENGTVEFKTVDKYGNESDVKSVEVKDLNEKTKPSADDEKLSDAKEKLQDSVAAGEKKDLSGYTDDSKKAYEEALDKVKEVLASKDATLEDVQAATDALAKAEKGLTAKSTELTPSTPSTNTTPSSNPSSSQASENTTASDKNKANEENKDAKEEGKSTKVMFKSVLYTKDLKKTSKTAKAYSFLNFVVENDKLKVYTFNGQHFYKVVDKDEYVRVRNVTGTKAKLKRNSYVYKSNGKKTSRILLKKGTTVTVYGDQYKALKKYKKTAYRIGEGKYIKSVNFYKVDLAK